MYGQYGQPVTPYNKLEYNNLNPIWYTTNYDFFYNQDSTDGYNCYRTPYFNTFNNSIKEGKFLYQFLTRGAPAQDIGSYVIKTDLESGNIVWFNYFGLPLNTSMEHACLLKINGDNLEVITQINQEKYASLAPLINFTYAKRTYNKVTGGLKSHIINPPENVDALKSNLYNVHFKTTNPENFLKYEVKFKTDRFHHNISEVNIESRIGIDSIYSLPVKIVGHRILNPFEINIDTLILVEYGANNIVIRRVDKQLHIIKEIQSSNVSEGFYDIELIEYNEKKGTYLFKNGFYDLNQPFFPYVNEWIVLDENAQLIKKFKMPFEYRGPIAVPDQDSLTLISTNVFKTTNNRFVMYVDVLKEKDGQLVLFNRFVPKDSLRNPNFLRIVSDDDDNFVVAIDEEAWYEDKTSAIPFQYDINGRAKSLMKLNKNIIRLSTNTKNEDLFTSQISPNPVECGSYLTLQANQDIFKVELFTITGVKIKQMVLDESTVQNIEFFNVPIGTYFLVIYSKSGQITTKQLIII